MNYFKGKKLCTFRGQENVFSKMFFHLLNAYNSFTLPYPIFIAFFSLKNIWRTVIVLIFF